MVVMCVNICNQENNLLETVPMRSFDLLQGLADAFIKMRLPFESEEASKLNRDIFETIYFGAVNASVEVCCNRYL